MADARKCLETAFKEVDVDGSGFIDAAEVEKVLTGVYNAPNYKGKKADAAQIKKEANDMIASMDQNNDKKVSLAEFLNFFEKMMADCAM
jgi:Ca2+-binding EF-hand superfamily protein